MVDRDVLTEELKSLRKGRAALHPDLLARLGPQLRQLCGITRTDSSAAARAKLGATIQRLVAQQGEEVRAAALAQFAVHPDATQKTIAGRQEWLAMHCHFQARTARRRMDEALDVLVTAALETGDPVARPDVDWRVCAMEAVLQVTADGPRLTERRVIEFVADGLDEITCRLSVPCAKPGAPAPGCLAAEAVFGVQITDRVRLGDEHYAYRLQLPRRFRTGESHEYAVTFQVPAGQPIANHYVLQPLTPCDEFRLIIRFGPGYEPGAIWQLDGVPPRLVDSDWRSGARLSPNRFGEVYLSFRRLRQGLAYGIKWQR